MTPRDTLVLAVATVTTAGLFAIFFITVAACQ